MDVDLSPDEDELDEEDESDELDDLEDPRITEVDTDEEEAPKLVRNGTAANKGNNKRAAEESDEEPANLDDIMAKSLKPEPATNGEPKLSKKQMKKLKNNAGKAVEANVENKGVTKGEASAKDGSTPKSDKKVQFAKHLEQGPSGTSKDSMVDAKEGAKEAKKESKKESKQASKTETKIEPKTNGETPKASLGPKTLQGGVKIDDKKLGHGPACKKGNKVGMRYIGKLMDGKVFDGRCSALSSEIQAQWCLSQQEGGTLHLHPRHWRGDQRLGHRCSRHVCRWRASHRSACKPGLRIQVDARHTCQLDPQVRCQTFDDQLRCKAGTTYPLVVCDFSCLCSRSSLYILCPPSVHQECPYLSVHYVALIALSDTRLALCISA